MVVALKIRISLMSQEKHLVRFMSPGVRVNSSSANALLLCSPVSLMSLSFLSICSGKIKVFHYCFSHCMEQQYDK